MTHLDEPEHLIDQGPQLCGRQPHEATSQLVKDLVQLATAQLDLLERGSSRIGKFRHYAQIKT